MACTMKVFLALSCCYVVFQFAGATNEKGKPQVTRTSLHVSRSLNPLDTELLDVRAKDGGIATLIVKRREGRRTETKLNNTHIIEEPPQKIQDAPTLLRAPKAQAVPEPVNIKSDMVFVKDTKASKKGRNLQTVGEDGVVVVEGVRVPDTPEDAKQVWRNARVINGILVPYKQSFNKGIPLKSEKKEVEISSNFDAKNISMFDSDDAVTSQWKGIAETIINSPANLSAESTFNRTNATPSKIVDYIYNINRKEIEQRKRGRSLVFPEASERIDENVDENEEPVWVNDQPKEIWTDQGKVMVADRRIDTEGEKDEFVPVARLLHPQSSSNYPTSSLYSAQPSRLSFEEGVRTPVLQYAHPELGVQTAKVTSSSSSSSSTLSSESETSTSNDPKAAAPLIFYSKDPHADRSPYAYEPGLNGEDTLASNSDISTLEISNGLTDRENGRRQANINLIELTTLSPLSSTINPDEIDITEDPSRNSFIIDNYRDSYGIGDDKYIKRYPYTAYPYGNNYHNNKDDYVNVKWKGGYGGYNGAYYIRLPDERPFWEKITDSIKETVQSGVESVKDLTRPVVDPIMEATQRISQNLGINEAAAKIGNTLGLNQPGTGMRNVIQEKIDGVVSKPVVLPALGLLAGGAALGLGAVAVGRLFDVNVNLLKRSEDGEIDASDLEMEHKRALESIQGLPDSLKESAGKALILPVEGNEDLAKQGSEIIVVTNRKYQDKPEQQRVVLIPINHRRAKFVPVEEKTQKPQDSLKRLIDESGIEALERFHFHIDEETDSSHKPRRKAMGISNT